MTDRGSRRRMRGMLAGIVALTAMAAMARPVQAQGREIEFGLSVQFDDGQEPSIAINNGNTVVETHRSQGLLPTLWYHVGQIDGPVVRWGSSLKYDSGANPACAINNSNVVVEVHKSETLPTLWYHVGRVTGQQISFGGSHKYDSGVSPAVAMNSAGTVVEVHKSEIRPRLFYHVGTVSGNEISWGGSDDYDNGVSPSVAMNDQGLVVEVHQSEIRPALFYHIGHIAGKKVQWGSSVQYDSGIEPSVSLTPDGLVVEVHRSPLGSHLWRRIGAINGSSINWISNEEFDSGASPSVACNSKLAVQSHKSETFGTLWYSTSLITDRANWMGSRLNALGSRTLKQIAMPGAHDASMYLSSVPAILGRTQSRTIYEQLKGGVRYFDLRPKAGGGELYMYHGPIKGPSAQTILADVKRFMAEGHRELVILKFSHFDFGDYAGAYNQLATLITADLSPWLLTSLPAGKRLADVPLQTLIGNGGKVIALYDHEGDGSKTGPTPGQLRAKGIWVYRDYDSVSNADDGDLRVYDVYANSMSYDSMKADQFKKFQSYTGTCKPATNAPCDLFLLSWTLTPPTDVWALAQIADSRLAQGIRETRNPNPYGKIINIVYVDFFESSRVTDVCLWLNGVY